MNIVMAIDPGLTGACALLGDGFADVFDLPAKDDPATGRRIDAVALAALLPQKLPEGATVRVCIESLANGGFGRTSAATVGSQFWTQGTLVSTLELLGLQVDAFIPVPTWKRFFDLAGKRDDPAATMRRARELASQFYPDLADFVQRQRDHNRAEAILIGHFFRRTRS